MSEELRNVTDGCIVVAARCLDSYSADEIQTILAKFGGKADTARIIAVIQREDPLGLCLTPEQPPEPQGAAMSDYDWIIERDGAGVFISHRRWSLVGMGKDLVAAATDLDAEIVAVYAQYVGRSDLSPEAKAMVAWMEHNFCLRTNRHRPVAEPQGAPSLVERTCARCGLTDATVLDLDTGSACHPELLHCIRRLRERIEALEAVLRMLAACECECKPGMRCAPCFARRALSETGNET
jgi:hypothetical protein